MDSRRAIAIGSVTAVVAGLLTATQLLPGSAPTARAAGLVGYRDCDELLAQYRQQLERSATAYGFGGWWGGPAVLEDSVAPSARAAGDAATGAVGSGPTGTNLQEQGVDEPDLAKLADGRLVVLTGSQLRVLRAGPQPQLQGSLDLSQDQWFGGGELLLTGDRAVVVLQGWGEVPVKGGPAQSGVGVEGGPTERMAWPAGLPKTRVVLVDVGGEQPRLMEEATYDGSYVSARLVDGTVRLVTRNQPMLVTDYPTAPGSENEAAERNRERARTIELNDVLPQVKRRDAAGTVVEDGPAVTCEQTSYAPGAVGASTLLVTTLRPQDGLAPTDRTAVTTDGDLVYASTDRLYVATSRWGTVVPLATDVAVGSPVQPDGEVSTQVHAFDTASDTKTTYVASGEVPGYVYGRWALSEYEGVLRVATTRQPPWDSERETSSMVVKLAERDGKLVETARVGGLGRTEHIRAVRYFGELAAVVTFRQTDPLYLVDLGDEPRVLGELKIPGFSTYLHPLGDGLLLGVGQDATDQGQVTGMQVSVFDISDPAAPRQVDKLRLGQGHSPALDDSRAFSYDPARRTVAFTYYAYDVVSPTGPQTVALGIRVGQDGRLAKVGEVAYEPEPGAATGGWASRVLLGTDTAYVVGDTGVVAADPNSMTRTGGVDWVAVG